MQLWQHADPNGKLHYSLVPILDDKKMLVLSKEITEENSNISLTCVKIETDEEENNLKSYVDSSLHLYNFYTCDKCNMNFPIESMLNRHKMFNKFHSWLRKKRLKSRHRSKLSSGKQTKPVLSQKPRKKSRYGCTSCEFICIKWSTLIVHIRKKHKSVVKKDVKISCIVCNRKFGTWSNLNKHMEEHRDRKTTYFTCNSCSFVCKKSSTLISHITQNHQTLNGEEISKEKCNDELWKKEESRETCLKKQDKDSSTVSNTPFESQCNSEPSMATRVNKKQSEKPVEEQCDLCDFKCANKGTLYLHKQQHETDVDEEYSRNDEPSKKKESKEICLKEQDKNSSIVSNAPFESQCNNKPSMVTRAQKNQSRKPIEEQCSLCNSKCAKKNSSLYEHKRQHKIEVDEEYTCNDEPSKEKESKENCLKEQNKDNSIVSNTPFESQCNSETSMVTRAQKKQSIKPVEEQCDLSDFTPANNIYSRKRHYTIKIGDGFSCSECSFKTYKRASLYSHVQRKHKPPKSCSSDGQPLLFYCTQCDYKNKNRYELKVHVTRKHTEDFKFFCDTCGKKYKVKGDLTNHIRFSHNEQPIICDVCGKTCLNSNSLYVHQKFAHYKAKYECQICKRRMVSQKNLDTHMARQHDRRERVICEECGKSFSRNSRLSIHMRTHTGYKPYTCIRCNKSFARKTSLKQHMLIHSGIRAYICDVCGKSFTQKPGLISHRKCHPGPHPPLPKVFIDHILNDVMNIQDR